MEEEDRTTRTETIVEDKIKENFTEFRNNLNCLCMYLDMYFRWAHSFSSELSEKISRLRRLLTY